MWRAGCLPHVQSRGTVDIQLSSAVQLVSLLVLLLLLSRFTGEAMEDEDYEFGDDEDEDEGETDPQPKPCNLDHELAGRERCSAWHARDGLVSWRGGRGCLHGRWRFCWRRAKAAAGVKGGKGMQKTAQLWHWQTVLPLCGVLHTAHACAPGACAASAAVQMTRMKMTTMMMHALPGVRVSEQQGPNAHAGASAGGGDPQMAVVHGSATGRA